jgi:hypothetical protein
LFIGESAIARLGYFPTAAAWDSATVGGGVDPGDGTLEATVAGDADEYVNEAGVPFTPSVVSQKRLVLFSFS